MVGKCLEHTGFYMVINTAEMFTLFSWLYGENQYHVHSCTDRTTKPDQRSSALTSDHVNKPVPSVNSFCPNNPPLTKKIKKKRKEKKRKHREYTKEGRKNRHNFYFFGPCKRASSLGVVHSFDIVTFISQFFHVFIYST